MPSSTSIVWPIATIVLTAVGVAAAIIVPLWLRKRKGLAYTVLSNTPVVSVGEGATDDVEVFYRSVRVQDVRLVVVKLWNSGNVPILKEDFSSVIAFTFPCQVLACEFLEMRPPDLPVQGGGSSGPSSGQQSIEPLLLNRGDSITLKFLLGGFTGPVPPPRARIAGVERIVEKSSTYEPSRFVLPLAVISGYVFILVLGSVSAVVQEAARRNFVGVGVLAFAAGGTVACVAITVRFLLRVRRRN